MINTKLNGSHILLLLFLLIVIIILISNNYKRKCICPFCKCYANIPHCNCANCKCGCSCDKKNTIISRQKATQALKKECATVEEIKQNIILSLRENDKYKYMIYDNLNYIDDENDAINYMQMPQNGELYIV